MQVRFEYHIIQTLSQRENHASFGWNHINPDGTGACSTDATFRLHYPWAQNEVAGTFPIRVCDSVPDELNKILGINLPDTEDVYSGSNDNGRILNVPEFEWDCPIPVGTQRAGNYDLSTLRGSGGVNAWSIYWTNFIKNKMLEKFGTVRNRPDVNPTYIFRLVYWPGHHSFCIQPANVAGGVANWPRHDEESGQVVYHQNDPFGLGVIFGGSSNDHPAMQQLYYCPTVLGMHFSPTNYQLSSYDYSDMGHDKRTGSVDFEQRDCSNAPPPPSGECGSCDELVMDCTQQGTRLDVDKTIDTCDGLDFTFSSIN